MQADCCRGTRIHEDTNKLWFMIMDFKKATELFANPEFDGDPIVVYNPEPGQSRRGEVTRTGHLSGDGVTK